MQPYVIDENTYENIFLFIFLSLPIRNIDALIGMNGRVSKGCPLARAI